MRTLILFLTASVALFAAACDFIDSQKCPDNTDRWIEYQLFMGRGGPDDEVVDDAEWDEFLAEMVTLRFPDGFTVLDGRGQWRGSDGEVQREGSIVLMILAPSDDDAAEDLIDEVSAEYKRQFDQESVLKTVNKTCVAFQ